MTAELLFALLTLALWIGVFLVCRGIFAAIRMVLGSPGHDRTIAIRTILFSTGIGGLLLLVGGLSPKELGRAAPGPYVPIIWLYAPIPGWVAVLGAGMVGASLIKASAALTASERQSAFKASAGWLGTSVFGLWWLHAMNGRFSLLRGGVPLHWPLVVGLFSLLVAAMAAMVWAERTLSARGMAKKFVVQVTLMAGAAVFSLPFVWLLTTSFKEERDLANTDGIVWVPQVQDTHPFHDPEMPLFKTTYNGRNVQVKKDSELAGGKWLVEVERPYGIRGRRFETSRSQLKEIPRDQPVWSLKSDGGLATAFTVRDQEDGSRLVEFLTPPEKKGQRLTASPEELEPVRHPGLKIQNYSDALEWMPLETNFGLAYLTNTLWLAGMSVLGTVLSCSIVAYGFARLRFPGRDQLFFLMLMTMMLPGAVTMLPQFLIFTRLGWMDSLLPLWVPTFFAGAFNVFLLKQFFGTIPMELEEAARIDGCGYWRTYWQIMLPLVKPALAVIAIWTFMGAWNNFMGPLIYVNSPAKMPISYAMGLFASDRGTDQALMMAFATMSTVPVILLFFFAQKYFIEGVQLSGMGGR